MYLTWDDINGYGYMGRYMYRGKSARGENSELKCKEFCIYVCVRGEKSWNIEPKDTKNIYFLIRRVLKHKLKEIRSQYLICSYFWCGTWEYFNFLCIECATWQNLILSHIRSILIYIYIYILVVDSRYAWEYITTL